MALFKQIIVTLVVVLAGLGAWFALDGRAGSTVLNSGFPLPSGARDLIASLSPPPVADTAETGPAPSDGARGGRGGRGGAQATLVVAEEVGTSLTRARMRAIGTGEAERSVTVYPDITGIIETVPFKSGDVVAVGDVLAELQNDAEEVAVERARIGVAAAEEKLARFERLESSRTITSVEVTDVTRELETARLDLRAAEVALEKRRILAPIAGRVGIVSVDTGDLVGSQTVITTIDDREQLKVIFYTPETFVPELSIDEAIEAVSTARPEDIYSGRISAIDSRLDEASRTLRTEATIDNPNDELRPGMSFTITLSLEGERLLAVDPLSVQWERNGAIVWKIADAKATKAPVRIVERTIDSVLVTSDVLRENDLVAVEGIQSLREGGTVEVQNAPRTSPGAVPTEEPAAEPPPSADGTQPPAPARLGAADERPGQVSTSSARAGVQ